MKNYPKLQILFLLSLLVWFFLVLSPSVSAEVQNLGVFRTSSCVSLRQVCANCTFVNISSVDSPLNSTTVLGQVPMTKIGIIFNYTFCNTSLSGTYTVNGFGDKDGSLTDFVYTFVVNPLGKILTNSQAILYFLVFVISFMLFILCLTIGFYIPSKNTKDQMTGYIIAVENRKYLRMFMFCVAYLFLMLMVYFGWVVSFGYLDMDFLGNLFNFLFFAMAWSIIPLFIIGFFVIVANIVRDANVSKILSRGGRVR